jgi:DNA-binding Xre family transcriptional regulator
MSEKELAKIKKQFGSHLKKIRESDMNESNISKYENGKRDPRLSTILKLAKMLKVHPKELLNFDMDFLKEK